MLLQDDALKRMIARHIVEFFELFGNARQFRRHIYTLFFLFDRVLGLRLKTFRLPFLNVIIETLLISVGGIFIHFRSFITLRHDFEAIHLARIVDEYALANIDNRLHRFVVLEHDVNLHQTDLCNFLRRLRTFHHTMQKLNRRTRVLSSMTCQCIRRDFIAIAVLLYDHLEHVELFHRHRIHR